MRKVQSAKFYQDVPQLAPGPVKVKSLQDPILGEIILCVSSFSGLSLKLLRDVSWKLGIFQPQFEIFEWKMSSDVKKLLIMAEGLECVEQCLERRPRTCSVAKENQDKGKAGEFVTTFLPEHRRDAIAGSVEDYIRLTVDQFGFLLDRVRRTGKAEHGRVTHLLRTAARYHTQVQVQ
ncbi:MAG: hypothetical protein GY820_00825 [Gammaproteobacteria bacterium]|nr:hypothetical protein [Gammaproteobacteria bacterium]